MCTTTPGCGRSASTRIEPASTDPGAKRSRSTREVVEPVEQRQHDARLDRDALQRARQAGGLGRDDQRVDRLLQSRERARARDEVAEA